MLGKMGLPRVPTFPAQAQLKFGGGTKEGVGFFADITAGIAEAAGHFTASVLDADIPASLRKGGLEALGAQRDFPRDTLTLGLCGVEISPESE